MSLLILGKYCAALRYFVSMKLFCAMDVPLYTSIFLAAVTLQNCQTSVNGLRCDMFLKHSYVENFMKK